MTPLVRSPMRLLRILALAVLLVLVPIVQARAQLPEGIGLGITPTVERIEWDDDIRLEDADLYGGRFSLNFGRFVSLQPYWLVERDEVALETAAGGDFDIDRRGADLILTAANTRFTPFLRVGAGTIDFEGSAGGTEHITATLGGGLKFDLTDRLQLQVFAQDLALRATTAPFIDRAPGEEEAPDDERTFHNLSYGAGVNVYLGGEGDQPETDVGLLESLRGGLGGVAVPVELFGGEFQFDDDLGLEDQNVAGVRAGINFGPYVGVRGYYLRGVNDDVDDVTDFDGFGGEAIFNLNRGEGFTPYLIIGVGKLDFTNEQVDDSALTDDEKWTATAGAGLAFNLSPRFRLEAAARNLLLSQGDAEDVTEPEELKSNWLFSGGLRFAIGGSTGDRQEAVERIRERERERILGDAKRDRDEDRIDREDRVSGTVVVDGDTMRVAAGDTIEIRREPRTFELPVLEQGEIYIRFGESGTFERIGGFAARAPGDSVLAIVEGDTMRVLRLEDRRVIDDRAGEALERIDRRLEEIDDRIAQVERRQGEAGADVRIEIEEGREVAGEPAPREPGEVARPERGIFNGDTPRVTRTGAYSGVHVSDPQQLLIGLQADIGSAFGGRARVVPDITIGFFDDTSITLNGHLEWAFDRTYKSLRPFVGTGLGLFAASGELEILIPNFLVGAMLEAHPYRPFIAYQGLDLFDDNRFLVGIRTF